MLAVKWVKISKLPIVVKIWVDLGRQRVKLEKLSTQCSFVIAFS